jgi:hypothetical protein
VAAIFTARASRRLVRVGDEIVMAPACIKDAPFSLAMHAGPAWVRPARADAPLSPDVAWAFSRRARRPPGAPKRLARHPGDSIQALADLSVKHIAASPPSARRRVVVFKRRDER